MLSACVEFVCKVVMQIVLKTLIQVPFKKLFPKGLRVSPRLLHGCWSWVGSDMLGRALSPCREDTSSSWAWAGAQFGLLTIPRPCKPTLLGFQNNPPLGGVWGPVEGFASCGTYGMKSSSNKAQVGSAYWALARSGKNRIWYFPYTSSMKGSTLSRQTVGHFDLWCQLPHRHLRDSHMIFEESSSWQKLVAWQLFFRLLPSGFLSNFSPHSNLAKVLSKRFSGTPRETKCFTTAHLPKDWSGFAVKSNGPPYLFQGKVCHHWSTWHMGKNKIASCWLGTLELKDNYYQPKRFEK